MPGAITPPQHPSLVRLKAGRGSNHGIATALYADVYVPSPVILQLRVCRVNIAAASEHAHERKTDEELLYISTTSGRVLVTQDIRFRVLAEDWQRAGGTFSGSVFAHQRNVSFGEMLRDLELIAKATDPTAVCHLPLALNLREANGCADPDIGLLSSCPPSTDA